MGADTDRDTKTPTDHMNTLTETYKLSTSFKTYCETSLGVAPPILKITRVGQHESRAFFFFKIEPYNDGPRWYF